MAFRPDGPVLTGRSGRVRNARQLHIAKHRRARGQLLAEGPQAVRAALATEVALEVFVAADWVERRAELCELAQAAGVPIHVGDDNAVGGLTSALTPQGIVAVCRWQPAGLAEVALGEGAGQWAIAHELADPGNCGALIRVADAVGAFGVALSAGSVDPTNPKSVRSTAGSLFHLPVVAAGGTLGAVSHLRAAGFRVLAAAVAADAIDLFAAERAALLTGPVAWVFGNEAHGLPSDVVAAVDHVVRIPIIGQAESLNVAAAAAVCMYAHLRGSQRPA